METINALDFNKTNIEYLSFDIPEIDDMLQRSQFSAFQVYQRPPSCCPNKEDYQRMDFKLSQHYQPIFMPHFLAEEPQLQSAEEKAYEYHTEGSISNGLDLDNSLQQEEDSFNSSGRGGSSTNTSANTPIFTDIKIDNCDKIQNNESTVSIEELEKQALDFDDLNDCVSALLKKPKGENGSGREVKRRQRKNKDQIGVLFSEFYKNPHWSRDYIKRIS